MKYVSCYERLPLNDLPVKMQTNFNSQNVLKKSNHSIIILSVHYTLYIWKICEINFDKISFTFRFNKYFKFVNLKIHNLDNNIMYLNNLYLFAGFHCRFQKQCYQCYWWVYEKHSGWYRNFWQNTNWTNKKNYWVNYLPFKNT